MRWASLLMTGLATSFLVIGVGSPQPSTWAASPARPVDVLVYGGTPGGIAAALAASQGGAKVVLIEPTAHVGGLVTSGLSHTDFRTFEGVNGTFQKFAERVEAEFPVIAVGAEEAPLPVHPAIGDDRRPLRFIVAEEVHQ